MRNVTIRDRNTGEIKGNAENLPDTEADLKAALINLVGYGAWNLRWKAREKKDGKMVEFPRQKVVYALRPLTGQVMPAAFDKPDPGLSDGGAALRQGFGGTAGAAEAPFIVQLILRRLDDQMGEIRQRLADIVSMLEEDPATLDGIPGTDLGGFQVPPQDNSMGGVFKSVLSDPQYAGLIGGIMASASDPERLGLVVKEELAKNPQLISGLIVKFMPMLLEQGE